jgi:hypothetical protein
MHVMLLIFVALRPSSRRLPAFVETRSRGRDLQRQFDPAVFVLSIVGPAVLYRNGPSRRPAKWRWISVGSIFAASAWMAVSSLFSWYLGDFANYNATYGALGAVVGLMMWMWLSTIVVLVGAELNSEIEHQTSHDSTVGPEKPLGIRGAELEPKPVSPAQLLYAKGIAQGKGLIIPDEAKASSAAMSAWIDSNRGTKRGKRGRNATYKSAGSVAPRSWARAKRSRKRKAVATAAPLAPAQPNSVAGTPLRIPYGNKDVAMKLGAPLSVGEMVCTARS